MYHKVIFSSVYLKHFICGIFSMEKVRFAGFFYIFRYFLYWTKLNILFSIVQVFFTPLIFNLPIFYNPCLGHHVGQNLRGHHRDARVPLTQGLVPSGAPKHTNRQVALPGHLSLSRSLQDGYVYILHW